MTTTSLGPRLRSFARRVQADLEASASTQHDGSRGTEREEIFANFLSLYLPGTVEVIHNAEIIAASGEISPQCDILIADRNAPRIQDLKSHRIVPAECVYGIIEVKSTLTGPELKDACTKIRKAKEIPRDAFLANDPSHWLVLEGKVYKIMPMFGIVFGYDSIHLNTLGDRFITWCGQNTHTTHPDGVWVFNKGTLAWGIPNGGRLVSRIVEADNRELRLITPSENPADLALILITRIASLLTNVRLPPLQLGNYLTGNEVYNYERNWQLSASAEGSTGAAQ